MNNRFIVLAIGLLGVGALIIVISSFLNRNQYLTVSFSPIKGSSVSIREDGGEVLSTNIKPNERTSYRRGTYIITATGENIQKETIKVDLKDKEQKVFIPISLKEAILEEEKPKVESKIREGLTSAYPSAAEMYNIMVSLHKNGEWATAYLISKKRHSNSDSLYAVLRNDSDKWTVVASPARTISTREYPNIPYEVLRGTLP